MRAGNIPAAEMLKLSVRAVSVSICHRSISAEEKNWYKIAKMTELLLQHNSPEVNNNLRELMMFCLCFRAGDEAVLVSWLFVLLSSKQKVMRLSAVGEITGEAQTLTRLCFFYVRHRLMRRISCCTFSTAKATGGAELLMLLHLCWREFQM